MNESCLFCQIARRERPAYVVFENDLLIGVLDHDPINEGHVLLIPKRHYLEVDELPADLLNEMMRAAQMVVKALRHCFATDGYSIMQNGGVFNDIGHYHLHIFPRHIGDGFGWTDGGDKTGFYSEKTAQKIASSLAEK